MPNIITGVPVDKNRFVGVTTLNELVSAGLVRPSTPVGEIVAAAKTDRRIAINAELRQEVQRTFNKERRDRAAAYARYIVGVQNGVIAGGAPPINLYVDGSPTIANGVMTLGRDPLCVIDGETQTEARFIIGAENPDSYNWTFPVVAWHSYPDASVARQYLVDCNLYANPISSKTALSMDTSGRLTTAVRDAIEMAGFDYHRDVNVNSDLPGSRRKFSLRQATAAATGYALNGFSYGRSYADVVMELNNPVPSADHYIFDHNAVASATASIIGSVLGLGLANDTSPMVWMAAGVMARQNHDVRTLDFGRAAKAKLSTSGSVDGKIAQLKKIL